VKALSVSTLSIAAGCIQLEIIEIQELSEGVGNLSRFLSTVTSGAVVTRRTNADFRSFTTEDSSVGVISVRAILGQGIVCWVEVFACAVG